MRNKNYLPSIVIIIWATFLLQSCSTFGYENVDTTRKAIIVANAELRAANLLLQDMIVKRQVNREQAETALASLQDTHNFLQNAADSLALSNDSQIAESNLQRATSTLSLVISLLAPFAGEPE